MRPGDVALSRDATLPGWAIRLGTRSRFNHARLVVSEAGDTIEAQTEGAIRWGVELGDLVLSPPLSEEQRAALPAIAKRLLGTPYAWLDVAAIGLAQFGVTLPSVRRRIERPDRLFCSQLVDLAWSRAGFHAFDDGRPPQAVSPGDLADLALLCGWSVETV